MWNPSFLAANFPDFLNCRCLWTVEQVVWWVVAIAVCLHYSHSQLDWKIYSTVKNNWLFIVTPNIWSIDYQFRLYSSLQSNKYFNRQRSNKSGTLEGQTFECIEFAIIELQRPIAVQTNTDAYITKAIRHLFYLGNYCDFYHVWIQVLKQKENIDILYTGRVCIVRS